MEMPRAFSSGRRSVSTPVSVFTSRVLPWSMWPAVATIMLKKWLVSRYSFLDLRAAEMPLARATRNEQRATLSYLEVKLLQLIHELLLVPVIQAAQIHDERAVLDPPYDG